MAMNISNPYLPPSTPKQLTINYQTMINRTKNNTVDQATLVLLLWLNHELLERGGSTQTAKRDSS
jgi:hypothetical protein